MTLRRLVTAAAAALVLVGLGAAPASASILDLPGLGSVGEQLPLSDPLALLQDLLPLAILGG